MPHTNPTHLRGQKGVEQLQRSRGTILCSVEQALSGIVGALPHLHNAVFGGESHPMSCHAMPSTRKQTHMTPAHTHTHIQTPCTQTPHATEEKQKQKQNQKQRRKTKTKTKPKTKKKNKTKKLRRSRHSSYHPWRSAHQHGRQRTSMVDWNGMKVGRVKLVGTPAAASTSCATSAASRQGNRWCSHSQTRARSAPMQSSHAHT